MAKRTRLAPLLLAVAAASGLLQQCTADRTQENIDAFAKSIQNKIHCTPTGLSAYDCIECLSAQNVLRNVPWENKNTSRHPSVRELEQLSVVVLHRLSNMMKACTTESDCSSYQQCLSSLLKRVTPRSKPPQLLLRFEDMLRHIKGIYMADSPIKCFTAEEILAEVGPFESTPEVFVEKLSLEVVKNLLNGRCIEVGDAVTDFLEDLFKRYGDNSTEVITQQGLERLLKRLRVASQDIGHDHEHSHDHSHDGHSHEGSEGGEDPKHAHHHEHDHKNESVYEHEHEHDHKHEGSHEQDHELGHKHDGSREGDHKQEHKLRTGHGHEQEHDHDHDHSDDHVSTHSTHDHTRNDQQHSSDDHTHSHDHDHDHDHDDHSDHDHQPENKSLDKTTASASYGSSTSYTSPSIVNPATSEGFEEFHTQASDNHDHSGHDHDHLESPRAEGRLYEGHGPHGKARKRRNVPLEPSDHESHKHNSSASKCWTTRELIRKFGQAGNGTISKHEFFQLCPALIQQAVTDVCRQSFKASRRPTNAELYGYGTLAVFIISLCSLVGVLLLPCLARYAYYYIMMGFIGLSFGTMTGDAMLHLIPQILGLHSHDAGDHQGGHLHLHSHGHDHGHGDEEELVPPYFWKQLGLIGAFYGLFVFEALSVIFTKENDHDDHGHGHSHLPKNIPDELRMTKVSQKTESNIELAQTQSTNSLAIQDSPQAPVLKSSSVCCGMSTLATVVIIGGAIHNVADGLAIGAAFSSGLKGGLSTSIAVFCHELPHEFGDFVVLISTGLGYKKALFLNFLSALAAFAGLYAGFQVGENIVARNWILTVTAGIFLYVSLVDMLPELKQYRGKSPFKMFIVKNIGVLAGVAFMCVIAIYEDKLNI
ncbi:zinc transporter ZIP10 [Ixodes scapularis]|uniref:zinc transporter ZIP10 n=1 Tax=Ixodes scapularis TaxID=6945 RepID=UPI001A9CED69|nr:zinc transporter ZIP10 [Ixodes scapularis]